MNLAALAALLSGALAIASSGIFFRLAETGPIATAFWRVALAVPFFAAWWWWERRAARAATAGATPRAGRFDRRFLLPGLFFAGDLIFWHWALSATSIAAATLESNLTPIFVALALWVSLGERPTRRFVVALLVSLAGVLLIASPKLGAGGGALRGDAFGVVTALFYAGYLFTVSRLRSEFSTAAVMLWTVLVTALLLLPLALTERFLPQSAHGWAMLLGLALVAQCIGQGLITYALAHLSTAFSSVGLYMQPVAAALYAWWILGERLLPVQLVGGVIVLVGITLARAATQPPAAAAVTAAAGTAAAGTAAATPAAPTAHVSR
jgi:drug/metabolite transporter (DMT)-like permease